MRRYIAFILIFVIQSVAQSAESENFKLAGDVELLSHYVEHGLSQSNKSPAIKGDFWFNMGPQFRLGIEGASVNYEGTSEHFNLRLKADLKVDLSANVDARLNYTKSDYYDSSNRNGNDFGFHLRFWDYRVIYSSFSNWEGSSTKSARYGFATDWKVFTDWTWGNEVGYNTPSVSGKNTYFDLKTGIGNRWGPLFIEGSVTATSDPSQFDDGEGDLFFILSAKANF
jgi:hypothetical protein